MNEVEIQGVIEEVMREMGLAGGGGAAAAVLASSAPPAPARPAAPPPAPATAPKAFAPSSPTAARIHDYMGEFPAVISARSRSQNETGVYERIEDAIDAGEVAFRELSDLSLEVRGRIIQALRDCALKNRRDFAERTREETGIGRVEHKMAKFETVANKTPGIEIFQPRCFTGDHGLTVDEFAPYGVVGAITPVTHPLPTMVNNAISFIAGGNVGVFNGHPSAKKVFAYGMEKFNRAIMDAGGPPNLISTVFEPTIESGKTLFNHPKVRLLLVTGGPAVVKEALRAPKRAICAGPGNPPVVVDETADLGKAAEGIIAGGGFDNNVLCIGEKQIFVVDSVADALIREMTTRGCLLLDKARVDALTRVAFGLDKGSEPHLNRNLVGRDAAVLARAAGLEVTFDPPLLIGETDFKHPFVQEEQMMPFIPIVRCRDVEQAIDMAIASEHGYGHTAVIHSRNIRNMHEMAKRANTTIFVKNGPSTAALGSGGEGFTSFSIAGPTGEGCTTALTFTRMRRCSLVDYFRIV